MTGYALHPEARSDLDEIWEYIRADSVDAADRVVNEILTAIRALVPFPHTGHRRPDLTSRPLRFITVRDYLIAYAPDEKPLWVVAVMHGQRSPRVMAAILRSREGAPGHRRRSI
jgi:plasmid stabilization system protein ParE